MEQLLKQKLQQELKPIAEQFFAQIDKNKLKEMLKDIIKRALHEYLTWEGRKILDEGEFFTGDFFGIYVSYAVPTELKDDDPSYEKKEIIIKYGYIIRKGIELLKDKYDKEDYDKILTAEIELTRQFAVRNKKSVTEYLLSISLYQWVNPHPEDDEWEY